MQDFSAIRLLILDDDELVRSTIQTIAESSGIQCHCTGAPADFFSQLDSWRPTHISLDLVMPEMDGLEVILELAVRECTARIFITSGISERILHAARRSAHEHGLDVIGALPKPFTASALRTLIEENPPLVRQPQLSGPCGAEPRIAVTEEIIRQALERKEFNVVYQPKVTCHDGELIGAEALVRWQHPEFGIVSPAAFIPFVESSGLIHRLTEHVLDQALRWRAAFGFDSNFHLAVNLSALTIAKEALPGPAPDQKDSFADRLALKCLELQIRPSSIILELTESSAMENPVDSLALLTRLRMKGFQLSIDDFGTGFSSMQQLARLPFSEIKVDQSFVASALQSAESRTIIRSIIDLGHSLGLRVTAEGVEDLETFRWLKKVGCNQAQGFLIGRPMPPNEFLDWIETKDPHLYSDEQN